MGCGLQRLIAVPPNESNVSPQNQTHELMSINVVTRGKIPHTYNLYTFFKKWSCVSWKHTYSDI